MSKVEDVIQLDDVFGYHVPLDMPIHDFTRQALHVLRRDGAIFVDTDSSPSADILLTELKEVAYLNFEITIFTRGKDMDYFWVIDSDRCEFTP